MFNTYQKFIHLIPFASKIDKKTIHVNLSKIIGIEILKIKEYFTIIIYCNENKEFRLNYSSIDEAYNVIKNAFKEK